MTRGALARRVILPGTRNQGIFVNPERPRYCWRDLEGVELVDVVGANKAALVQYRGAVREYAFEQGDMMDVRFHVPHDYVPNTPMFLHLHWSHNGTAIAGALEADASFTYAKGHQQDVFCEPKVISFSDDPGDINSCPQYQHRIPEERMTLPVETAATLPQGEIEVDGLILLNLTVTGIPVITGGAALPFIHRCDIHYLSKNIGTINRAPYFYASR